jgi:homogentisate 1,2-dioxygenase
LFGEKDFHEKILHNADLEISLVNLLKTPNNFMRNADFDELYFIHEGLGRFETIYGPLDYKKGDYVVIPRGTTYKIYVEEKTRIYLVESNSEFEDPTRGILGPNALYDQSALVIPEAAFGSEQDKKEYVVQIKRLGQFTFVTYPFNPLDAKGWKGSLYPKKLSIYDFCPVMSHRYHMPPSAHTTFVCKGFVICSFVERPLEDSGHGVLKVPFYHSNIDYDEVLFYHQGHFFSRDNIKPGALTFHPQGIHHGPHPKAFKNAEQKTYTDEYAVMVDTRKPLKTTEFFEKMQNPDYYKSWT